MEWTAIFTGLLALSSFVALYLTHRSIKEQREISLRSTNEQREIALSDLKVRNQLRFEEIFDSQITKNKRKLLAHQLLKHAAHDKIQEDVMDLFESIGTFLRRGYLDQELVWCTWGYYGPHWWNALKDYILTERKNHNDDQTLFEEFQYLADELYQEEMRHRHKTRAELEPSSTDLRQFLKEEASL
ncbi:MAG: hypothetical protein ABSC53_05025 [Bacteroidota bacterium]|jgi:hypothetical protein